MKLERILGKIAYVRNAVRTGIFILVGIGILSVVSAVMVSRAADSRNYNWLRGFYEENAGTIDAVYIGSSVTYSGWLSPLAWDRYGIAVSLFTCNSQPFVASEYIIKEARKTQPDALFIVPILTNDEPSKTSLHYLTDNLPLSWNKVQLVRTMGKYMGIDWTEQVEYLFPLIRYHSRWTELTKRDFFDPLDGVKGGSHYTNFLRASTDVTSSYRATERTGALPEIKQSALDSLLEYCAAEQVNVLFVQHAGLITNESDLAESNSIREIVEAHGYPVLSLRPSVEEIGLDTRKDYYNAKHTNIHGAIKITDYLSRYLVENYGFEDKRGNPDYSSWDDAYAKYTAEYASAYTLDVEWNGEPRDKTLAAPVLNNIEVNGTSLTVSWDAVPGAEGYQIYRKNALGKSWTVLDAVDRDTLSYEDTNRKTGSTYYYTVIAYREEKGLRYWGDYDFAGITGKALLNAPKLLSLEGSENDLILTWESVKGADGYAVFRKLPSKSWIQIADVGEATTFTDIGMLSDMPYQYTVKAYYRNGSGGRVMSSYNTTGLLYAPELELPMLEVTVGTSGEMCLSWEQIEGIQGYTVYRRTQDNDWEPLTANDLPSDSTEFYDVTAQAGVRYTYKVEAFIRAGDQEHVYELKGSPELVEIEKAVYDTAMPEVVYLEQVSNQVYIVWEPAVGASSYMVYKRTLGEDGSWSEWTPITSYEAGTTYLDTPAAEGTYEYLIRALFEKDGLTYYGAINTESGTSVNFGIESDN